VTEVKPKLTLRLGTHAEKEYLEKMSRFLDGVFFGANLVESTPGATASLIVSFAGQKQALPYYVDPMTYTFGAYVDKSTGEVCDNLDWLKSERKLKGSKEKVVTIKPSYKLLAGAYGSVIAGAVTSGQAVSHDSLADEAERTRLAKAVVEYQLNRIKNEFKADEEFPEAADDVPLPAAVFAPYFYCDPASGLQWLRVNVGLAAAAVPFGDGVPVHAILCADKDHLEDEAFIVELLATLPGSGVSGVWLWFSQFAEEWASQTALKNFRRIVEGLSKAGLEVHNLHGGYFSLALSKFGLRGISHGVGYGEQKDVTPQLGQAVPVVRYYLPAVHRRLGVLQIERAFDAVGVTSVAEFHKKVCGCAVCRGLVVDDLAEFRRYFGETKPSAGPSGRDVQTPSAAKRCRFHFLLVRLKERDEFPRLTIEALRKRFDDARDSWGKQPSIKDDAVHLERWRIALG
jgi:hypothetical protein